MNYPLPSPLPEPEPIGRPERVECIIPSVHYADFLVETLPHNRILFDRTIVVTAPEDHKTREVCKFLNVECVLTDEYRTHWGEFVKGAGINAGIRAANKDGWLVQLDSDILLPQGFRHAVDAGCFDPAYIYGVDRVMVKSFAEWQRFYRDPEAQKQGDAFVHPRAFPIGHRLCIPDWVPIGYFQMWHASAERWYPTEHKDAARGDVQFALQWPRRKRALIPEVYAYHLESENAVQGANWGGRTTVPFGLPKAA